MSPSDLGSAPIRFRIRFGVTPENAAAFERMLLDEYVPALREQRGFRGAVVLLPFPVELSAEIGATTTPGAYELEFDFSSESARREWVAQPVHDPLWAKAESLSTSQEWGGFFTTGDAPGIEN